MMISVAEEEIRTMEPRRYVSLAFWAKERQERLESLRENLVLLSPASHSSELSEMDLARQNETTAIEEAA
jgi:hypothetical protein